MEVNLLVQILESLCGRAGFQSAGVGWCSAGQASAKALVRADLAWAQFPTTLSPTALPRKKGM